MQCRFDGFNLLLRRSVRRVKLQNRAKLSQCLVGLFLSGQDCSQIQMSRSYNAALPCRSVVPSPEKFYKGGSQEKTLLLRPEFFLLPSPRERARVLTSRTMVSVCRTQ